MARVRSPNYPAVSLTEAIERARKVYEKEHTHKAAPEVVAKALGYSGLNGASLSLISALKKFGLLEEVGKDLKISHAALTILVDPKDSAERAKLIRQAAFAPALFSELQGQYGDTVPSDENLRSYLLKRGFAPSAVDSPIRSYRETIALVSDLPKEDNEPLTEDHQEAQMQSTSERVAQDVGRPAGMAEPRTDVPVAGIRRDVFSLDEGRVILEWPEKMSADSYNDFQSWVEIQLRKIKRSIN
jgi:hypothetical protein